MYKCPECALVVELKKNKAAEAMKCFQCNISFEPHLHPAGQLLAPKTLHNDGKERLSQADAIGTLLITSWWALSLFGLFLLFAFFLFLWIISIL